jgi:hypothetical protein
MNTFGKNTVARGEQERILEERKPEKRKRIPGERLWEEEEEEDRIQEERERIQEKEEKRIDEDRVRAQNEKALKGIEKSKRWLSSDAKTSAEASAPKPKDVDSVIRDQIQQPNSISEYLKRILEATENVPAGRQYEMTKGETKTFGLLYQAFFDALAVDQPAAAESHLMVAKAIAKKNKVVLLQVLFLLVELIVTCRALGLMRLAHSAKYILCAHTTEYNNFYPLDAIAYHDITCRATRPG